MRCPNCQNEILEEASYCPHCGLKIEKCPACNQILHKNANFCSHCGKQIIRTYVQDRLDGYYQPLNEYQTHYQNDYQPLNDDTYKSEEVSFKDIPVSRKVNKKIIILSVIALIVATGVGGWYLLKTGAINPFVEPESEPTQSITIKGDNDLLSAIGNLNQGGHVTVYKERLYVCDERGYLYSIDSSLQDYKQLTDYEVEYVQIDNDIIYYVNNSQYLCRMNLNGENQEVLLSKEIYYPVVYKDKIYYQSDDEGERLHVYDLNKNEDKELNQRITYNINVTDEKIYYTSTDGIYCIGIHGQGEEKLSSDHGYSLVLKDNTYLYYSTSDYSLKCLNVQTLTSEKVIDETSSFMNMNEDYLFYLSREGLKRYDLKTKESKTIFNVDVDECEIAGDKLVITTSENIRVIMDFDGNSQVRLFITTDENFV